MTQSLQRDTIIESSAAWRRAVIPLRRGVDLKFLASHDGLRDTVNLSEGWGKTEEGDWPRVTLFFHPLKDLAHFRLQLNAVLRRMWITDMRRLVKVIRSEKCIL